MNENNDYWLDHPSWDKFPARQQFLKLAQKWKQQHPYPEVSAKSRAAQYDTIIGDVCSDLQFEGYPLIVVAKQNALASIIKRRQIPKLTADFSPYPELAADIAWLKEAAAPTIGMIDSPIEFYCFESDCADAFVLTKYEPNIFISSAVAAMPTDQRRAVLLHELQHNLQYYSRSIVQYPDILKAATGEEGTLSAYYASREDDADQLVAEHGMSEALGQFIKTSGEQKIALSLHQEELSEALVSQQYYEFKRALTYHCKGEAGATGKTHPKLEDRLAAMKTTEADIADTRSLIGGDMNDDEFVERINRRQSASLARSGPAR